MKYFVPVKLLFFHSANIAILKILWLNHDMVFVCFVHKINRNVLTFGHFWSFWVPRERV